MMGSGFSASERASPIRWSLTPGEFVRVTPHRRRRKADHVEQMAHRPFHISTCARTMDAQRLRNDVADRLAWVEGGVWILEHHLHPAPKVPQLSLGQATDVLPVEDDRAVGGLVEPHQCAAHRGA
jgi:hypothetical protein